MPKVGDYGSVDVEDLDFSEEATVKTAAGTRRIALTDLARLAQVIGSFLATEDLLAGHNVNIFLSGGVAKIRKADASDTTKPADGFVRAAALTGASAKVYGPGAVNDQLSGLTIGASYWLSETAGETVNAAPTTSGAANQKLGRAVAATSLLFQPGDVFEA